jgi:plastocyanin
MVLRAAACLYAMGVALACPVALHAEDPPAPAPAEVTAPAEPASSAEPPASDAATTTAEKQAPAAPGAPATPSATPEPSTAATAPPAAAPEPAAPAAAPVAVKAAGSVSMRDFSFAPGTITIRAGESVTWVNSGKAAHNATGDGFATPLVRSGQSASHTFAQAGTFSYVCTIHAQMRGAVKVVAAQQQAGGGGSGSGESAGSSSGSGAGSSTGAGSASPSSSGAGTGPQLAATGLDAWLLGATGLVLLAAGVVLRRRVASP